MPKERLFDRLSRVFSNVGEIKINQQTKEACIDLRRENDNTLSGAATIIFEQEESVKKAIEKYNEKCPPLLNGAEIRVEKFKMKTERAATPPPVLREPLLTSS
ncbi:unnamed protein product, partial [Rotaria sordida]